MSDPVYADRTDLDDFGGLPDGALENAGRIVASTSVSSDVFELDAHGLVTNEEVSLRPLEGHTLPTPLVEGVYYAIRVSDSAFKLATAPSGPPIDITAAGGSVVIIKPLPIDRYLALYSRWVDGLLPAHVVPLEPNNDGEFPLVITAIVAQLAGKALLNRGGKASAIVDEAEKVAMAQVERFAKGLPLRTTNPTTAANKAVVTTISDVNLDPRGWGGGRIP